MAASVARELAHQRGGVAAGELEEHQIGRRVVEEGRQKAGEPEIGHLVRRAVLRGDRRRAASANGAVVAGLQHRQHRDDADENAGEQLGHLGDRLPGEIVGLAVLFGREPERGERDDDERAVAHEVLQGDMRAVDVDVDARLPGGREQDGADDAGDQRQVDQAAQAQRLGGGGRGFRLRCAPARHRARGRSPAPARRRWPSRRRDAWWSRRNRRRAGSRRTAADRRAATARRRYWRPGR